VLINTFASSSPKNFAIGPFKPSSSTLSQAKPFAPYTFTNSVNASMSLREYLLAAPFALIAFTCPPLSTALVNTLKPQPAANSDKSVSSISKRVSGLSEP